MPLAMVIVVFMCWFLSYSFRRESLEYNYEQIDSNLTYSLLAAAIINFNEYAVSGNLIISDGAEPEVWDSAFINSYIRFMDCLTQPFQNNFLPLWRWQNSPFYWHMPARNTP